MGNRHTPSAHHVTCRRNERSAHGCKCAGYARTLRSWVRIGTRISLLHMTCWGNESSILLSLPQQVPWSMTHFCVIVQGHFHYLKETWREIGYNAQTRRCIDNIFLFIMKKLYKSSFKYRRLLAIKARTCLYAHVQRHRAMGRISSWFSQVPWL